MNGQVVLFGAIAVVVTVGADFFLQAQSADTPLGEFGVSGYVDSIKGRIAAGEEAKALAERQAQNARDHLPGEVDGWTRREWVDADFEMFRPNAMAAQKEVMEQLAGAGPLGGGAAATPEGYIRHIARTAWIYERGDEAVMMRAEFSEPQRDGSFSGQMMQIALGNMAGMTQVEGFAFEQGVGFGQARMIVEDPDEAENDLSPISLTARFGHDETISIAVEAAASPESVRALIAEIDFDALNAMLTYPDPNVGSHVPSFDLEDQITLAEMTAEERLAAISDKGIAAETAVITAAEEKGAMGVALGDIASRMGFSPSSDPVERPNATPKVWTCVKTAGGSNHCSAADQ